MTILFFAGPYFALHELVKVFFIIFIALTYITTLANFWNLIMYLFFKKKAKYNILTD